MIKISRLTKRYGWTTALADIDLEIARGESLAIVGPDGCGKTTLLRTLATLTPPTAGRVEIAGLDVVTALFSVRRLIAYAGDDSFSGHRLSVGEHLRVVASARRRPRSAVEPACMCLGLDPGAPVDTLPAAVRGRLALAAALVAGPAVIVLDYPLVTLDAETRLRLLNWLIEARQNGTTIVMSAAGDNDAQNVCQRIATLDAGRLVGLSATLPSADRSPSAALVGA